MSEPTNGEEGNEPAELDDWPQFGPDDVLCRRVMRPVPPKEHERCPYCFGRLADVETGKHAAFCDFREGKDPIHFGFPSAEERADHG